jgi:hypothetical protein
MSGISISRSEINRGLHIVVQYIIVRGHCQVVIVSKLVKRGIKAIPGQRNRLPRKFKRKA